MLPSFSTLLPLLLSLPLPLLAAPASSSQALRQAPGPTQIAVVAATVVVTSNTSPPARLGTTKELTFVVNGMQPGNIDRTCKGAAFVPNNATEKATVDLACPEDLRLQVRVTTGGDGVLDVGIGYAYVFVASPPPPTLHSTFLLALLSIYLSIRSVPHSFPTRIWKIS